MIDNFNVLEHLRGLTDEFQENRLKTVSEEKRVRESRKGNVSTATVRESLAENEELWVLVDTNNVIVEDDLAFTVEGLCEIGLFEAGSVDKTQMDQVLVEAVNQTESNNNSSDWFYTKDSTLVDTDGKLAEGQVGGQGVGDSVISDNTTVSKWVFDSDSTYLFRIGNTNTESIMATFKSEFVEK